MNPLLINQNNFSTIFWKILLSSRNGLEKKDLELLSAEILSLQSLRGQADYNTGTISPKSALWLYFLTRYFKPSTIVEVGTFIGTSGLSMVMGCDSNNLPVKFYSCDVSNSIDIPYKGKSTVEFFKKSNSTQMFKQLKDRGVSPEMFHIDGRLNQDDLPLLVDLKVMDAIILLDDFEGVEKGVVNAFALQGIINKTHVMAYPPKPEDCSFKDLDEMFPGTCTTAVLLPQKFLSLTRQ
tara:strand:- start:1371 stop:2081 length:711 start_codon:yes stop_codon:yes gene_type:complete